MTTRRGRAGFLRRGIGKLGPSWKASPLRRLVQTVCLVLFVALLFWMVWPYSAVPDPQETGWPSHHADDLSSKESVPAELFLSLDPLVGISTAIAGRTWLPALVWAGAILLLSLFVPRGFCGYICPLGTLIDLFDAVLGRCGRVFGGRGWRLRVRERGPWVHAKHYILAVTLAAAAGGVLLSGFVAAIPVVTRGLCSLLGPIQTGSLRGWHQLPPFTVGEVLSVGLFVLVFAFGFLGRRFWCRYLCPTGAIFSLMNRLRLSERKVTEDCIHCHRCIEACPFDAIRPDDTTRFEDCTLCKTCGGVCPTDAIRFLGRRDTLEGELTPEAEAIAEEIPLSRRAFAASLLSGGLAAIGTRSILGADVEKTPSDLLPVRPPMSIPESDFLRLCIRCGECFRACPNHVLRPLGFEQKLEGLWTPHAALDWSGCDPSCNNCGQVCPTGAIRALPLDEKRHARMGLAMVDRETCLPWAGRDACQLCVDECTAAGYRAMEFERIDVELDPDGRPVEGTGYLAPVVLADRCVGCGLCQSACWRIQVRHRHQLEGAAVIVRAGPGREDRMKSGSYRQLREREREERESEKSRREKALLEEFGGWDDSDP